MGPVQLDSVEAEALGRSGRFGERRDDVVEVPLCHGMAGRGAVEGDPGRAGGRGVGEGRRARLAGHADVPQLRHDRPARRVHRPHHVLPAGERVLSVETGHGAAGPGGRVIDIGALGDDQADPARGPARVVVRDIGARDAAR